MKIDSGRMWRRQGVTTVDGRGVMLVETSTRCFSSSGAGEEYVNEIDSSRRKWRRRGGTTVDGRGRVGGDLNSFQKWGLVRRINENRLAAEVMQARRDNSHQRKGSCWWRPQIVSAVGLLARRWSRGLV
jgi:hypothetical protein